jgi:predicted XRE-type DNA-binding protein
MQQGSQSRVGQISMQFTPASGSIPNGRQQVKAELAHQIAQMIKSRRLTQQRAAELLGMPQPKLSEMLRGKFRGISQAKMKECLV